MKLGGGVVYDVMDGFHRAEGQRMQGRETIRATVVYECPDSEMVDLRILAASSVRSVQFPRLAAWITQAWRQTEWSRRDITVLQAFALALNESESPRTKLSDEELAEVRTWVQDKCKLWQRGPSSTHEILRVVANADPDLVMQVRASSGGRDRKTHVTPGRLKPVVLTFPGEENFDIQNTVMDQIIRRRLTAAESEWFVRKVANEIAAGKKVDDIDFGEIVSKIPSSGARGAPKNIDEPGEENLTAVDENYDFEGNQSKEKINQRKRGNLMGGGRMITVKSGVQSLPNPEDIFGKDPPMPESSAWDELDDDLPYAVDQPISNLGYAGSGWSHGSGYSGVPSPTVTEDSPELRAEIFNLREALKKAHKKLSLKNGDIDDNWFETAHFLSEDERKIMNLLFREFLDLDIVASIMREPRLRVIQFVQSAFRKRYLDEESANAELPVEGKTPRVKKSASAS